jgi:hypothetical protein
MNLKPLLIHKLLDCFERKYNTRVFHGGSWRSNARLCRAGERGPDVPVYRDINLGFRLTNQANEFKATSNPQTA